MADPVDRGLNFILEAIKVSPVGVLVIPMGLGLILIVAEQMRKTPRPAMLKTIWMFLGVCVFLSFASAAYSWLVSEQRKALEYASRALDQQIDIYETYVKETPTELFKVTPEVKVAWKRTEDAVTKLGHEACKSRNELDRKTANTGGSQYNLRSCSTQTPGSLFR